MENILGSYNVIYNASHIGELNVSQNGLMTVFSSVCRPVSKNILRLYCISGGKAVPIGVMMPCRGGLSLSKTFSRNALRQMGLFEITSAFLSEQTEPIPLSPEPPQSEEAVWQPEYEPWRLFEDDDIRASCRKIKGAYSKSENGRDYLAVPISPYEPFPTMPIFCFGSLCKINGGDHIVFTLENGKFV